MAWTTPGTATAGEVLTAAFWNEQVRDNSAAIRDAQINVQSTIKQDTFSTTSTTYVDVTGLSVTITPSSATSKVLVIASLSFFPTTNSYQVRGVILRGSTIIAAGTPAGSRPAGSFNNNKATTGGASPVSMTFLDSPATSSATTYKIQIATEGSAGAGVIVNAGRGDDANVVQNPRTASTITVIEVPV